MNKDKLLWMYSTIAWVCGVVDSFGDTTQDAGAKRLFNECDSKLTEVGNILHNELLGTEGSDV